MTKTGRNQCALEHPTLYLVLPTTFQLTAQMFFSVALGIKHSNKLPTQIALVFINENQLREVQRNLVTNGARLYLKYILVFS